MSAERTPIDAPGTQAYPDVSSRHREPGPPRSLPNARSSPGRLPEQNPELKSGIQSGDGIVQDGRVITSGVCPYMAKQGRPDGTTKLTRALLAELQRYDAWLVSIAPVAVSDV